MISVFCLLGVLSLSFKNSVDTNLLILDEIFDGSLDTVGSDEVSFILRTFNKNANVFVISHRDNLTDKFDRVLQFTKPQNFSKLEVQDANTIKED